MNRSSTPTTGRRLGPWTLLLLAITLAAACGTSVATDATDPAPPTPTQRPTAAPDEPTPTPGTEKPSTCIERVDQRRTFDTVEDAPIVLWTGSDPWLHVIGADSPSFALYESGRVIYRDPESQDGPRWLTVVLDHGQVAEFIDALDVDGFLELDGYIELAGATDQPTDRFIIQTEGCIAAVSAYGLNGYGAEPAPEALERVHAAISGFRHADAVEWQPSTYEVTLSLSDRSAQFDWADEWPGLDHPAAWARRDDAFSLYFSPDHHAALLKILEDGPRYAELDERVWQVNFRIPFPHEVPANWTG